MEPARRHDEFRRFALTLYADVRGGDWAKRAARRAATPAVIRFEWKRRRESEVIALATPTRAQPEPLREVLLRIVEFLARLQSALNVLGFREALRPSDRGIG